MSIMRWLWGNANQADANIQEFQIRLCDPGLNRYKEDLIVISNRLASTEKRRGSVATQECWFAGKLDNSVYVLALGGEQNTLLNARYQGTRGLFCAMAYGLTGEDIRLFRRDKAIFQPLMELMRQVNDTGTCSTELFDPVSLKKFALEESIGGGDSGTGPSYNIMQSNPKADEVFWRQSMRRPVAIGMISEDDAKRLINRFPQSAATVWGDVEPQQHRGQEIVSPIRQRINEAYRQQQKRDQVQLGQGTNAHRPGNEGPGTKRTLSISSRNQKSENSNQPSTTPRETFWQKKLEDFRARKIIKIIGFLDGTWTLEKEDMCSETLCYLKKKEGLDSHQLSSLRDFALLFAYENKRCCNHNELMELFQELIKSPDWHH